MHQNIIGWNWLSCSSSCRTVALRKNFCWQTGLSTKIFPESYRSAAIVLDEKIWFDMFRVYWSKTIHFPYMEWAQWAFVSFHFFIQCKRIQYSVLWRCKPLSHNLCFAHRLYYIRLRCFMTYTPPPTPKYNPFSLRSFQQNLCSYIQWGCKLVWG